MRRVFVITVGAVHWIFCEVRVGTQLHWREMCQVTVEDSGGNVMRIQWNAPNAEWNEFYRMERETKEV
jgi:hypothetical protein